LSSPSAAALAAIASTRVPLVGPSGALWLPRSLPIRVFLGGLLSIADRRIKEGMQGLLRGFGYAFFKRVRSGGDPILIVGGMVRTSDGTVGRTVAAVAVVAVVAGARPGFWRRRGRASSARRTRRRAFFHHPGTCTNLQNLHSLYETGAVRSRTCYGAAAVQQLPGEIGSAITTFRVPTFLAKSHERRIDGTVNKVNGQSTRQEVLAPQPQPQRSAICDPFACSWERVASSC
jgi:hypothetical protein